MSGQKFQFTLAPTFVTAILVGLSLAGCTRFSSAPTAASQPRTAPIVAALKTQALAQQPAAAYRMAELKRVRHSKIIAGSRGLNFAGELTPADPQPAIQGDVTFTKSEIFARDFLFGSDLQYSSIGDASMNLLTQSMSIGHMTAHFEKVGDRLQLIADQKYLFQSDINHPGRLIHEWPVIREDATTITVSIHDASATLVTFLGGPKAADPRQSWVRSIEFVAQGNYLLIESSVEQEDGTIAEFMESVFPRDTLVPAGATPKVLLADGDLEPLAKRYRFLGGDPLFLDLAKGRTKTFVANHFPVPAAGQTIDWYVTTNIPAIYIPMVKAGVEGWNRYSQKMWNRDIVRFVGTLPTGIKIGDPRYNVINWDSVPEAGAAYESQAADPTTGLQSHSLIYLPFAWVKIGEEYWKRGGLSADDKVTPAIEKIIKSGSVLGEALKIRCMQDLDLSAPLEARTSPEVFARELLKQVLFHEVGHAMGLAHNFKGSLTWNPTDPKALFSSSIMDYNQYQIEGGAYTSEGSSDGPLLEYDRQVISVLYNDGKDVASTDPVLPACEDTEADSYDGGVDPLCMRYDAGEDPTVQLKRTIELVKNPAAVIGHTQSLSNAILEVKNTLGDASTVVTEADVDAKIKALTTVTTGTLAHYYSAGAQSLAYMTKTNVKSLYVFKDDVLPAPYDAKAMLTRSMEGISYTLNVADLEPSAADALTQLRNYTEQWLKTSAWYTTQVQPTRDAGVTKKLTSWSSDVDDALKSKLLPKMRTAVIGQMVYKDTAPFSFSLTDTPAVDAEKTVMDALEKVVTEKLDGDERPIDERVAAATSLRTFTPVPGSDVIYNRIASVLGGRLASVQSASDRADLRKLLKAIQTPPAPPKEDTP